MARNNNLFTDYKNKVQGAVQRDLLQDVNFQNAELFKQNIYKSQVNQGLSYNQYQANIRRKLNNSVNGIIYNQQLGLTGSSGLRQQVQVQQDAGLAISGTANSYAQTQQEATDQLNQADYTQSQLRQQYTEQEANQLYQSDMNDAAARDSASRRKYSAIFGGIGALGAILSFIPFTAPLGAALDIAAGVGMATTSAVQLGYHPNAANGIQFGLDTLFAGFSMVPGISALRSTESLVGREVSGALRIGADTGISRGTNIVEKQFETRFAEPVEEALFNGTTRATTNSRGLSTDLVEPFPNDFNLPNSVRTNRLTTGRQFPALDTALRNSPVKAGQGIPSEVQDAWINSIRQTNTVDDVIDVSSRIIPNKELEQTVSEVAKETGQSVNEIKNSTDPGVVLKMKNKLFDSFKFKSTYDRSLAAKQRLTTRVGDKIGSRKVISAFRSGLGTATRGVARGAFIGGGRYVSSSILNNYLGQNGTSEVSITKLQWRKTFDDLGIPQSMRPAGL